MLAIQIEKRYTKPEIVTLYCNQIPWGHGTYGAEAAARLYFGKSAKDVTLEEAALLAGIIQAPARHSPYVNLHERACAGATTRSARWPTPASSPRERAEQAKKAPIVTVGRPALDTDARVLRRGGAAAARGALRRAAALRERPGRLHDARPEAAARRRGGAGRRACAGSITGAASASRSASTRPTVDELHASELDGLEREGRRAAGGRVGRRRRDRRRGTDGPRARRRARTASSARADYAWTGKTTGAFLAPGDVVRVLVASVDAGGADDHRHARSGAGVPGRGARHRRTAPAACWRWSAAAASS